MRRSFTVASVVAHTCVAAAVCFAQLLAVGSLPDPHAPLSFAGAIPIRVIDIPLPTPHRGAASAPASGRSAFDVAPIDAPNAIGAERSPEGAGDAISDAIGVERGIGAVDGFGTVQAIETAPPPVPTPLAPVRLAADMQPPRKLVHVDPTYPQIAQAAHIEGIVILDTVIGADGRVSAVRVLRSIPALDQAAIDAVKRWTFTPTLLHGRPVPIAMTVTVRFALTAR